MPFKTHRVVPILLLLASAPGLASVPPAVKGEELSAKGESELSVALQDKTARASVLVFLSARCPCSKSHEKVLAELNREFSPKGFRFVGINANADETLEEAREHFRAAGLGFPVLRDAGHKLADELGALKTPHVFVVAGGEIVFQGGIDDSRIAEQAQENFLRKALSEMAEGREPSVKRARALGCAIKR